MKNINNEELKKINGGGINFGLAALIGAGITFIIGVIDGYIRPLACH
jgi:lactobin A/cerein 7B family class IIb bacteriocin